MPDGSTAGRRGSYRQIATTDFGVTAFASLDVNFLFF
jgi:hypothetical protein